MVIFEQVRIFYKLKGIKYLIEYSIITNEGKEVEVEHNIFTNNIKLQN